VWLWFTVEIAELMEAGMAALTRILGYSVEDAQKFCEEAQASTRNKHAHMHTNHFIAYGQKPEESN
jgi:hypothetical protein